jgi:hypothetical protein
LNTKFLQRALLLLLTGSLLAVTLWCADQVHLLSAQRAEIKKDYSQVNNITYGLLSVNAWRDHLVRIVMNRIDDFEFTPEQETAAKDEIAAVLHAVINKADSMAQRKQKTLGGKIKKFAYKAFVREDKLHAQVPVFSQTIVNELKKPKNKEKLKFLAESKLKQFGSITYDSMNDVRRGHELMSKYNAADLAGFNITAEGMLAGLQKRTYSYTFMILGVMGVFLLLWWLLRKQKTLHTALFVSSVIFGLIVLFVGLTTPMIEIDARIKEMSFLLLGENISFHDQVIFFQSKSIFDVVRILIETGKWDSAAVGVLILVFSILFPVGKLIATKLYLLGSERRRQNKWIQFLAFKSGKWSMADVNVVAIFMAYIGFKGIIDNQLAGLNMKTESVASISTNETSLQPGFMLFVAFVLFGLILSTILQRITHAEIDALPKPEKKTVTSSSRIALPALGKQI